MADNPITNPLPADLPENWQYGQTVAPTGEEVGLSKQHGYNYLMEQVNAAQEGVNTLGEAASNYVAKDGDTMTGMLALPSLSAGGDNNVSGGIANGIGNFVAAALAATGGRHYKATQFSGTGSDTVTLNNITGIAVGVVLYFRSSSRTSAKTVTAVDTATRTITVTPPFQNGEFNSADLSNAFDDIVLTGTGGGAIAVGNQCYASYMGSAALGTNSVSLALNSFVQGQNAKAAGSNSHAEGKSTTASGTNSHVEGESSTAAGESSHAEGYATSASGPYAHAEGEYSEAVGACAHAEGSSSATGDYSHAEGYGTTASGHYSHAGGYSTTASADYSTIVGQYGETNTNTLFAVANGTSESDKSLAFEVKQDGSVLAGSEQVAKYRYGTEDLTAGESALPTGVLYFVYE